MDRDTLMTALKNKLCDTTHVIVTQFRDEGEVPDTIHSLVVEAWRAAVSDKTTEELTEPIRRLAAAPDGTTTGCRECFSGFYRFDLEMFLGEWREQDLGPMWEAIREAVRLELATFLIPKQARALLQRAARLVAVEEYRRTPPSRRHLLLVQIMSRINTALHEAPPATLLKQVQAGEAEVFVVGGGALFSDGFFLDALSQLDTDDPKIRAAILTTMQSSALNELTFAEPSQSAT